MVDLRNHGQSPHSEDMDIDTMADDVLKFMDELKIKTARVMGHSLGGRVGMNLGIRNPNRVEQLMLVDVGPFDYWNEKRFSYSTDSLRQFTCSRI